MEYSNSFISNRTEITRDDPLHSNFLCSLKDELLGQDILRMYSTDHDINASQVFLVLLDSVEHVSFPDLYSLFAEGLHGRFRDR